MQASLDLDAPPPAVLAQLGLVTRGTKRAWAVTSADDVCRYVLGRMWDDYFDTSHWAATRPLWCVGMLNPSDARHDVDDPTVRRVVGFARRAGAGGVLVVNLAAYSTPYPMRLIEAARAGVNVVGEHNLDAIAWATSRPALLGQNIAAWGRIPPRLRITLQSSVMQFYMHRPKCFGVNLDRSPKHPLYLANETPLQDFTL
jgi:hypothetical protein